MRTQRHCIRRAALLSLLLLASLAAPQSRAAGFEASPVALDGEPAPGGGLFTSSMLGVSINATGDVTFASELEGGAAASGVFVRRGGALESVALAGEPAPIGGVYFLFGGFPVVSDGGVVSYFAVANDGTALFGVYLDSGPGADEALLLAGDPAPTPPGGGFAPGGEWDLHSFDADSSTHGFISELAGGAASVGFFERSEGISATLALAGDAAPGGGSYVDIAYAHRGPNGHAAWVATLEGGPASSGLFYRPPGADSMLVAHAGDVAPGSGGDPYHDFFLPRVNAAGETVFLAAFDEAGEDGALFVFDGVSTRMILRMGDPFPGPGGGTVFQVPSIVPINAAGDLAMPIIASGGSVAGGVFVYRSEADAFESVALSGQEAPGAGGAIYADFGFVDLSDSGAVAFHATLSDARMGIFAASPREAAAVPALGPAALPLAGLVLTATGLGTLRRTRARP